MLVCAMDTAVCILLAVFALHFIGQDSTLRRVHL